ncbi:hypothetical protein J2850_000695 [Azospirillum picis]|uniref:Uncharacterized protein n=1 Tax=Azospirillum picis TaxID=488438 RepID=A0ABU0MEP2_9PROT|nr:hypothetical protein [Azospirillum picis]MDQ0531859.1 hypothetical protein [Azospirillum picis]
MKGVSQAVPNAKRMGEKSGASIAGKSMRPLARLCNRRRDVGRAAKWPGAHLTFVGTSGIVALRNGNRLRVPVGAVRDYAA